MYLKATVSGSQIFFCTIPAHKNSEILILTKLVLYHFLLLSQDFIQQLSMHYLRLLRWHHGNESLANPCHITQIPLIYVGVYKLLTQRFHPTLQAEGCKGRADADGVWMLL